MSFLIKENVKTPKMFIKFFVIKNLNIHVLGDSHNNLSIVKSICQDITCKKFKINSIILGYKNQNTTAIIRTDLLFSRLNFDHTQRCSHFSLAIY